MALQKVKKLVKRTLYLERIRPFFDSELVKVITGVRRCGKSILILQIIEELKGMGIADEQIISINFEDFQFKDISHADGLYAYLKERILSNKKMYILIDEIQNIEKFELVINSFRATDEVSIFITGSNSKLLSGELASHLAGRTVEFKILPFNFSEYYEFKKLQDSTDSKEKLFEEYLEWGGFPLVAKESDAGVKQVVLSNLYDSIVLKDIIMRNKLASPHVLQRVLDYIIANSSTTISGNNVAKYLSDTVQKVSAPTVYDYIRFIEEACVCNLVPRYDIRGKTLLSFLEKTYVCDLGFFKLRKNRVKDEFNYLFETLCYNELISRGYTVYVGKTQKGEIDFIAEKNGTKQYFQVAYLLHSSEIIEREFNAYSNLTDNYPKYVLSMDKIQSSREGIIHKNILDWLLYGLA